MAVIIQHFNINTSTPTTAPTMDDSLRSKNVVGLHGKKTTPKIQSNNNNNDNNTNRITLNSHKHNKNINNNNISNTITNTIIPTTTTTNNNNISIPPQPNQSPLSIANESQSSPLSITNESQSSSSETKNNTENNKDIGPKIKDKDNGIEIDNISAIIPEQPNKHYLSIIVSPEWNDSKLIPELVRHISQHTGKHIGICLGFFTDQSVEYSKSIS
eukprot:26171_1